jgi:hypothetical protein
MSTTSSALRGSDGDSFRAVLMLWAVDFEKKIRECQIYTLRQVK